MRPRRGDLVADAGKENGVLQSRECMIGRVAARIPMWLVRRAALAEPDLERYTIRLPAQGIGGVLLHPPPETDKSRCHGHSPLSVGPCFPYPLSRTGTPSLPPHYQSSSLLWAPPTSSSLRPLPRCLGLSVGARCSAPTGGSPWLLHAPRQARYGFPFRGW